MSNAPNDLEKEIRFGCGGLFGFFLGINITTRMFLSGDEIATFCITIFFFVCVCGILVMKQGNRFWDSLIRWSWWK